MKIISRVPNIAGWCTDAYDSNRTKPTNGYEKSHKSFEGGGIFLSGKLPHVGGVA